ncbi:MAG: CopG family transcriptional regulator [Burkholderiaceae bacterium]
MRVTVYVDAETGQRLNAFVRASGRSRSAIVREAILDMLNAKDPLNWTQKLLKSQSVAECQKDMLSETIGSI